MSASIALFITPHGFGHAARTIAVAETIGQIKPDLQFHLFTTVPEHLFKESLRNISYHRLKTDVGMIQSDALSCDVRKTKDVLDTFLPFKEGLIADLARFLRNCHCVLCDISPMGIEVARRAAIPSVLVENFTWDWIYNQHPELAEHAKRLSEIYQRADVRIQAEPACEKLDALSCPPVFRKRRQSVSATRKKLGVEDKKIILITLGGIGYPIEKLKGFDQYSDCFFLIAGQKKTSILGSNSMGLSVDSGYYHPDLICAADLVLCKSGYSSVAECYQAGTRVVAIDRDGFAESSVLTDFIRNQLGGTIIYEEDFVTGKWLKLLPELLQRRAPAPAGTNGADTVAEIVLSL